MACIVLYAYYGFWNSGVYLSRRRLVRAAREHLSAALPERSGGQSAADGVPLAWRHAPAAVRAACRRGGRGAARTRLRDDSATAARRTHGAIRRLLGAVPPLRSARAPTHRCVRFQYTVLYFTLGNITIYPYPYCMLKTRMKYCSIRFVCSGMPSRRLQWCLRKSSLSHFCSNRLPTFRVHHSSYAHFIS